MGRKTNDLGLFSKGLFGWGKKQRVGGCWLEKKNGRRYLGRRLGKIKTRGGLPKGLGLVGVSPLLLDLRKKWLPSLFFLPNRE